MKRVFLFVIFSMQLAARVNFAHANSPHEKALVLLSEGNKAYDSGRFIEAVEKYQKAWELGKLPEACYNLATTLDIELNRNKDAQEYYRKYFAIQPKDEELEYIYGLMAKTEKDTLLEKNWNETLKGSDEIINSLMNEYTKINKIKYDDSDKKEMLNENNKPFNNSASVCLGCHGAFMGPKINMAQTHPVGRIPNGELAKTVPNNVRFYKEGRVICLSCHDPQIIHFESGTKGKTYRVLRVDTGKHGENMSKFCAFCHSKKSSVKYLNRGEEQPQNTRRRRRR